MKPATLFSFHDPKILYQRLDKEFPADWSMVGFWSQSVDRKPKIITA